MTTVYLKRGREKAVLRRHPWIFGGAVQRVEGKVKAGDIVEVCNADGEWLARGYYNPRSQIVVRLLTWNSEEAITPAFWRRRLERALARREGLLDDEHTACRLVHAEADGLPGLIVDRYNDWLVLQALTLGIERLKEMLVTLLAEMLAPRGIYERSDVDVRAHEGLSSRTGSLWGETPERPIIIREAGLRFAVDLIGGHKTGFYLDQRPNRQRVASYCRGARVLNVFSYSGSFAVYAGAQSAAHIANVDSSAEALRLARENLVLNGRQHPEDAYIVGDAFQVLREMRDAGQRYDVVILDPPKFAFSRGQLEAATRGYKDINMLGMQLLRPGGILATFSCSGLVSADLFQKVLFGAALDVDREARILEHLSQGPDHPVLLSFPESAYLKGLVCRVE